MEKLKLLKILVMQAEAEGKSFYRSDNIRAAIRYRQLLQETRRLAQEIRMEVLEQKKEIEHARFLKASEQDSPAEIT